MEVKLKSGRKVKIKDVTLDERDSLMDGLSYKMVNGNIEGVEMMHSTMTKWMRTCIDGDTSDKALLGFSLEEKTELFIAIQNELILGEGKASK
jgi:hypothetical protein